MTIEQLKSKLPAYAKDIKLNLSFILSEDGAEDLKQKQIYYIALSIAFALKNSEMITALLRDADGMLDIVDIEAAKAAVSIMAMNNIYYRFVHLTTDKTFGAMPAKLRMNALANHGINKMDFELSCLAISALNGCGLCIDSHVHQLIKEGVSKMAIQSAVRIASVLNAVSTALMIA